jgi:opacity protein-like surface antigen
MDGRRPTRMRLMSLLATLALLLAAFSVLAPAAQAATTTPARPTNFRLYRDGSHLTAEWKDNSTNESGFRVQVCAGDCITKDTTWHGGTGNYSADMGRASTKQTCGWVWAFVNTAKGRVYSSSSNQACV